MYEYDDLREYFMATLKKVAGRLTKQRALILLIDGLDHLEPSVTARSLSWLPTLWPKHFHVVFTTDTGDALSMRILGSHIKNIVTSQKLNQFVLEECFFKVYPLEVDELLQMIEILRVKSHRELTRGQHEVNVATLPSLNSRKGRNPLGEPVPN